MTFDHNYCTKCQKSPCKCPVVCIEAVRAIKWSCDRCHESQYTDDTLLSTGIDYMRKDNILCSKCGHKNNVFLSEL